jgi:ferredoxin
MGGLLDFTGRYLIGAFSVKRRISWKGRRIKYYLLALAAAAAAAGWQAAWFFDPLSILARGFSTAVIPAFNSATTALFDTVYFEVPFLRPVTEPVYSVMKDYALTFEQQYFRWAWLPLLILVTVMALEYWQSRFWCRNLCPLGGLLSLCARSRALARKVTDECTDCGECWESCPHNLLPQGLHRESQAECTACMLCTPVCPEEAIGFDWGYSRPETALDLPRRRLITSAVTGMALVPLTRIHPLRAMTPPARLRPPGANPEPEFLNRCLRCGACMKVCMRNAIHPALHEAGWEGLLTPVMDFRVGYCEYNCILCGQVCPSEAIRRLPLEEKQKYVIGLAFIDKDRCIPYRRWENCIVCEEHCPVPEKAIVFEEAEVTTPEGLAVRLKRPVVLKDKCIGCGICEKKCPVEAPPAIIVTPHLETRRGESDPYGYG